jgi:hypothetical protein
MQDRVIRVMVGIICTAPALGEQANAQTRPASMPEGFRGFWYAATAPAEAACRGGMSTAGPQNAPMALYSDRARKTYFAFTRATEDGNPTLQLAVAGFDHQSGLVTRPAIVVERTPADPRANPAISIDAQGYLWIFAPPARPDQRADVLRSRKALDVSGFERMAQFPFTAPQAWFIEGKGFVLLFSRQQDDRHQVCWSTSADGSQWSEPKVLAAIDAGCDAVSGRFRGKIGVGLTCRPTGGGPSTGLYYLETADAGQTWTTARREKIEVPLTARGGPALVFDYASTGQVVSLKDINSDAFGNPTILYQVSRGGLAGTKGPYAWTTARWLARGWRVGTILESDSLCDSGCLHIENRSDWRFIATTSPGPEADAPGGEVISWFSDDFGRAWNRTNLTRDSHYNHNGLRRPLDAQPEFDTFWCDGAIRRPSASRLYFSTRAGKVYRLPDKMSEATARPELIFEPPVESKPETQVTP